MLKIQNNTIESKYPIPLIMSSVSECNYLFSMSIAELKNMVRLNGLILHEVSYEESYYFSCKNNLFKVVRFEDEMDLFELI